MAWIFKIQNNSNLFIFWNQNRKKNDDGERHLWYWLKCIDTIIWHLCQKSPVTLILTIVVFSIQVSFCSIYFILEWIPHVYLIWYVNNVQTTFIQRPKFQKIHFFISMRESGWYCNCIRNIFQMRKCLVFSEWFSIFSVHENHPYDKQNRNLQFKVLQIVGKYRKRMNKFEFSNSPLAKRHSNWYGFIWFLNDFFSISCFILDQIIISDLVDNQNNANNVLNWSKMP